MYLNHINTSIRHRSITCTVLGTRPHTNIGTQFTETQIQQGNTNTQISQKYKSTRHSGETQNEARILA